MKPFLALSFSEEETPFEKLLSRLSLKTPIDILRVNAREQKSSFDIYITDPELLSTLKLIRLDYSTIIMELPKNSSDIWQPILEWLQTINQPYTQVDLTEKKVDVYYSEAIDIHRYLYIFEEFKIQNNQQEFQCNDLTIEDIEGITEQTSDSNTQELATLLRSEKPLLLTSSENSQLLRFDSFTDKPTQINLQGELVLQNQSPRLSNELQTFSFIKPHKVLFIWANEKTNEGQLKYEFKKLLKQSKTKISEIKGAKISRESESVEDIYSFLEANLIDNEIDVTFNKDTIPKEIQAQTNYKDGEVIAERISDNSRLILINTGT